MEPVTHLLTGACLARTGFHRRVVYATAAMAVAAEFPDIDTVWSLPGPVAGFEHHRGLTHTLLGIPFEAGLLLLAFFLWHRLHGSRAGPDHGMLHGNAPRRTPAGSPAVRWPALYGLITLALFSHLLLDYTNNHGLRPFFPFNDRWYAGSIVFIFDPLLFLVLLGALVLPALFGLISREVGTDRQSTASPVWARAALACVVVFWAVRTYEHHRAVALAQGTTLRAPATLEPAVDDSAETPFGSLQSPDREVAPVRTNPLLQAQRSLASPDPLSIFRWYTATDFGPAYRLGVADTHLLTMTDGFILPKPEPTATLRAAERSHLGQVYLDWSPMPMLSVGEESDLPAEFDSPRGRRTVRFADPRFMGDTPFLHRGGRPPLTGEVVLGPGGAVQAQGIDGRFGR